MKDKVLKLLEKHQVRIAAGVQLFMCMAAIRSIFKKELRNMKKKYKNG